MSGEHLPEVGEDMHRGAARPGRPSDPGSSLLHPSPPQVPLSGRKNLSPWGSHQVDFHGVGNRKETTRRRAAVPTLGPLSYSLPVTPQGRDGGACSMWDGGAEDLAREAAEGWSVPPMPYGDVTVDQNGHAPQLQREQRIEWRSEARARRAGMLGAGVTGRNRSLRVHSHSPVGGLTDNINIEHHALAAAGRGDIGRLAADGGSRDNNQYSGNINGSNTNSNSDINSVPEEVVGEDREDPELAEEYTENGLRNAQHGEEARAEALEEEEDPARRHQAADVDAYDHREIVEDATVNVYFSPPQWQPSSVSGISKTIPINAGDYERGRGIQDDFHEERGRDSGSGGATLDCISAEGVLEKMAAALRQAGVALDPSLESEISSVLARSTTPLRQGQMTPSPRLRGRAATLPTTTSPPHQARASADTSPVQPASAAATAAAAAATSAETLAAPAPVRAFASWNGSATEGRVGGSGGNFVGPNGTPRPVREQSRERAWTVPSPYHAFDETFMSPRGPCGRRAAEFRLDDAAIDGGNNSNIAINSSDNDDANAVNVGATSALGSIVLAAVGGGRGGGETWRACSCGGADGRVGGAGGGNSRAAIAAGALATREDIIRAWKACVSCGAGPRVVAGGTGARGAGVKDPRRVETVMSMTESPTRVTVNPADIAAEEMMVTAEESSAFAEATRAADVDVDSAVASAELAAALENGRVRMDTVGQSSCHNDTSNRYSVGGGGGGVRGSATADDGGVGERGTRMMISGTVARGDGHPSAGGDESRSGGFYCERADVDDPDLRRVDDGTAESEDDGWGQDGNGGGGPRGMKRDRNSPTPPARHQAVVMQRHTDAKDNVAAMTMVDTGRKAKGRQLAGGGACGEKSGGDGSKYRDDDADLDEWDDDQDPGYMVMALSEDEFLRGDSHRLTPHAVLHSSPHPRKEFGVNAYEDNKCDGSSALDCDKVSVDSHDDRDDGSATNTSSAMLKSDQSAQLPLPPPPLPAAEDTTAFAGDFGGAVVHSHGSSHGGRDNALDVISGGDVAPVVRDGAARRNSDTFGCSTRETCADTGGRAVSEMIAMREEKPHRRHTVGGGQGAEGAAMVGALSVKPVLDDGDRRGDAPGRERAYLLGGLDDGHHRGWGYDARHPADGGGNRGHGSRDGSLLEASLRRESFGGGEDGYGHGQQYEQDLEQTVALLDGNFALDDVERGGGAAGVGNVGAGSWRQQHDVSGGGGGGDSLKSSGAGGGANDHEQTGPGLSDGGSNRLTDSRNGDRVRKGRFHDGSIGTGIHGGSSHGPDDGHGRRVEMGRLDDQLTSGGGGWGNMRARRVGGGTGHEVGRGGVMMELNGGRGSSGDGGDGTGGSRGSRRKHSFACSEMSAGSGGGSGAAGSRGGQTPAGSFDSSGWPRTASEFAFSQDLGDGQALMGHRDRGLTGGQSGTLGANRHDPRVSLDEAFQETGPHASPHDHTAHGNSGVKSGDFRGGEGGGGWEDVETVTASTSQHEEHVSCNSRSSADANVNTNANYPHDALMRLRDDGMRNGQHPGPDLTSTLFSPATEGGRSGSLEERCRSQVQGQRSEHDIGKWPGDDKRSHEENGDEGFATGQEVHATRAGHVATAQRGGESRGFSKSRSVSSPSLRTGVSANAVSSSIVGVDGGGREAAKDLHPESMTAGVECEGDDGGLGMCGGIGSHDEDFEEEELESFNLRVVYAKGRTGFQESKAFDWPEGSLVAGRYEVCGYIGTAAFSTALHCRDLTKRRGEDSVCLKVIKNNKDFFDQSLDEIKLLQRLKERGNPDEHHVLHMLDFFYFEEHLVIVSELLGENLYEFAKAVEEAGHPPYFTLPRLCKITRQCLQALSYVNSLGLLHCDVKPENILLSNYGKAEVKLIDFGSSCFLTDRLTTYTQSRSYRAPEVVLGLPYGAKVDMWSLGAVVAELVTGHVLLQSDSIQTMLARIQGIMGPFPDWMLREGEEAPKYFTPEGCVYQRMEDDSDMESSEAGDDPRRSPPHMAGAARYAILYPKRTCLRRRLRVKDAAFLDFASKLLCVDPTLRPEAKDALEHPWILSGLSYSEEDLWYPPNKKHASHGEDEDDDEDEEQVADVLSRGSDGDGGSLDGRAGSSLSSRRRHSS